MHFGISYISSFLEKHGHNTKLLVLSSMFRKKRVDIENEYLKGFKPKLICFTAVSTEYRFIADVAKSIKAYDNNIFSWSAAHTFL